MKITINIDGHDIELHVEDLSDSVDLDDLIKIDHGNIYGEKATIAILKNKFGLYTSDLEGQYEACKFETRVYEEGYRDRKRKQSMSNNGFFIKWAGVKEIKVKCTDKALDTCFYTDPEWQRRKKKELDAKKIWQQMEKVYWSIQSKDNNLKSIVRPVTPEEFLDELVEGEINSFLIRK